MSSRPIVSTSFQAAGLLRQAGYQQANRLLALHTPLGENRLLAERLIGTESVDDGGFVWQLTALSDDAHIPLKSLIGKGVRLDVQTADGRPRVVHGHVTAFELLASNGGFARYRLRIEPWLAFLRWRQDSFIFQDRSVVDIVDEILGDYRGAGSLAPAWRWELADRSVYPRRGITTQYRESDLAFVTRLLAEEGLYYWFEHEGEGDEGSLGRHTMVIADHPGAWKPNRQERVAFHRADATEQEDTLQGWQARRTLQTNQLKRVSWDYKSVAARPVALSSQHDNSAQRIELAWADDPGNYAWEDRAQGERLLGNALQALELRNKLFDGESTVRTMAPATLFTLEGHFASEQDSEDDRRFAVLSVQHEARNNFDEDLQRAVDEALGPVDGAHARAANADADVPFYRNRLTAVRAKIPYRPASRDAHGVHVHPKPTVHGSQSALVVGAGDDSALHTDRDHRVKVQFHWQRGGRASSRLSHPGGDNAMASDQLGAWLRVASATAGDNWGQVSLPRVGQEVLVEYLHGDIDRPVVVAALYNGAGEPDAQSNQKQTGAASATGNAPAWFAGQTGEHAHNAVFSGIKTQEMDRSQQGTGGYNQLVFDDSAGQARLGLGTTQASARLNLGHHTQQNDNKRGAGRGHGAELATAAHGAVRGGSGLLVSADAQLQGKGAFLDSSPAQAQTGQAAELARKLAESAQHQGAKLPSEPAPDKLPAIEALKTSAELLGATQDGANQAGNAAGAGDVRQTEGGAGSVTAYPDAQLQLSAPKGIGMMTPKEAVLVSGATSSIVATQDVNVVAQGQLSVGVAQGLSIYTMGAAAPAGKPDQERGIRLHAATGMLKAQSQAGPTKLAAQQDVTVSSTTQDVALDGKQHVLLTAAGAYVRLAGSSIQIHAPGAVTFRASAHRFVGPQGAAAAGDVAASTLKGCATQVAGAAMAGAAFLRLGETKATPAAASPAAGERIAAQEGGAGKWEVKDVLAELCPDDKAVVDKLANKDVTLVDALYFDDQYYDGEQWTTKRFDAGGQLAEKGGAITLVSDVTPEAAATVLYHEVWHDGQPSDMPWGDAEIEAYTQTEAWTIAKGFAGQDGDALRAVDAAGKAIPNKEAIVSKVRDLYPITQEPAKVASAAAGALSDAKLPAVKLPGVKAPPVTVTGRDANGQTMLSDGTVRAPREGDTYAGPAIKVGERTIPRGVWKCPESSKEASPNE